MRLTRRYRARFCADHDAMFDELIGNARVKGILKRMLDSDRLPGAMLFTGEEGIGKKLFALEVARALNCRTPKDHEGCGVCSSCTRIRKLNYPQREDGEEWTQIIWTDHPDAGLVVAPKRVLRVEQKNLETGARERNDRLLTVPVKARHVESEDADPRLRAELEQFFTAAVAFEGKDVRLLGWGDASEADAIVRAAEVLPLEGTEQEPSRRQGDGEIARRKGFSHVASGPLVRSSYHAADFHPVVRR